jgi:hypothetical protein
VHPPAAPVRCASVAIAVHETPSIIESLENRVTHFKLSTSQYIVTTLTWCRAGNLLARPDGMFIFGQVVHARGSGLYATLNHMEYM